MSTDAYLDAKTEFSRTAEAISDIGKNIAAVGGMISQAPGRFCFSNAEAQLPAEAVMGRDSKSFDGNNWLSAAAINAKLKQWHEARAKMMDAWNAIPHERRGGLVAPTEGRPGRDPYR